MMIPKKSNATIAGKYASANTVVTRILKRFMTNALSHRGGAMIAIRAVTTKCDYAKDLDVPK
jgi:Tfp pilus assembly ATPase PilU